VKAAEQGYAAAQYNLGLLYRDGQGVEQDFAKAVRWLRAAAEQDYAPAQAALKDLQTQTSEGRKPGFSWRLFKRKSS
jgi:TPR repeat protein